jgi:hypothetical protein
MMRAHVSKLDEIVSIARDQETVVFARKLQDRRVGGFWWKYITDAQDFVIELSEQICEIVRHVLIEQESHGCSCAICCATRRSISPR